MYFPKAPLRHWKGWVENLCLPFVSSELCWATGQVLDPLWASHPTNLLMV